MADLIQLHQAARAIFDQALSAVDARSAVRRAVTLKSPLLKVGESSFDTSNRSIYSIAIGKAAPTMARGLSDILGQTLTRGLIAGPSLASLASFEPGQWQTFAGGHPLPNQQSLAAAQAAFDLLQEGDASRALVIFLISGGGSAMLEWPLSHEVTLADLQETYRQLVMCGASIAEINAVRGALSAVKAGGLARAAPHTDQVTLIVSDTNPDDESSVASGPTLISAGGPVARDVVRLYASRLSLPAAIMRNLDQHERYVAGATSNQAIRRHQVLLSNQTALEAAAYKARELGFATEVADDIREQPIVEGCRLLLTRLDKLLEQTATEHPVCLLSGGEFSCPVQGNGVGGRNLETVLRCAIEFRERSPSLKPTAAGSRPITRLILSAGTDGIDGNSPAAGAVADEGTISRAREMGLDANGFLENSDAFTFFERLGSTIVTGATGTNVRDLRIMLGARA